MATATTVVQMYLSGAWTDVSADVMANPYIRWTSGFSYDEPTAFVADDGTLEFWLDNSAYNSGTAQGYYSPGHASARTGFELGTRVRIKTTYSATDRYQLHGRISEIEPMAGRYLGRRTRVIVTDYMNELTSRYIDILAIQNEKKSDELLDTLVDSMDIAPQATDYDVGLDTFALAFHDLQGEKQVASSVAQKIVQSDLSKLYVRGDATGGETLTLENRQADLDKTSQLTLNDTMTGLQVERNRTNIRNRTVVSFRPVIRGSGAEILYTLPDSISLSPSATFTLTALYRDPDGGGRISGENMITPVAETDFSFSSLDGIGNDLNASLGVSLNATYNTGGDRAEITFTNNSGTTTGYLWFFQLRGIALRMRDAVEVVSEDSASITAYGEKRIQFNTPYQNNFNMAKGIADYLKSKWANPKYKINKVSFVGNVSATLMSAAVNRDLGDMITVTETVTGVNTSLIIIGRRVTITSGNIWHVEYTTRDADTGDYFLLGTAGSSELGTTTTLGF